MNIRRLRLMLWSVTVTVTGATAALLAWGFQPPRPAATAAGPQANPPEAQQVRASEAPRSIALQELEPLWSLQLQRPLFDPPPPEAKPTTPPPPPPLRLRLMGTVIEPDNEQAILMTGDGSIVFARIGQQVEQARVQAIHPSHVELVHHEQVRTLKVEEQ